LAFRVKKERIEQIPAVVLVKAVRKPSVGALHQDAEAFRRAAN
jgi:hypothetical protein